MGNWKSEAEGRLHKAMSEYRASGLKLAALVADQKRYAQRCEEAAEEALISGRDEVGYRLYRLAEQEYEVMKNREAAARCAMRARKAWTILTGEEFV